MTGIYTVTEKMLQKLELQNGYLLDELRSRPAPARKPVEILTDAQLWDAAYKAGAAQAREEVLDKAKAMLDRYYKSLPSRHPYLDGIDLSIQKIEELQESLRQQEVQR